jgi:aminoglycoside phosphotransferase (APT) family kinase protein
VFSPVAEVEVDEGLVRALLRAQHPDLADRPLNHLDAGWDNLLWRLGGDLVVRLPRRQAAAGLILHEQRWLPLLARRLPLPVPVPLRVGRPSDLFPWSWSVVPWLAGVPGDRVEGADGPDTATRLGRFLAALHLAAVPEAPRSTMRGVPLVSRAKVFEERLVVLADQVDVEGLRAVWAAASGARPHHGPACWLHGDLHPANTLFASGSLSAVIDFGDVCAGDPATDLAALWLSAPDPAWEMFTKAYGGVDGELELRSIGWAVLFGLMLLQIGLDDKPTYATVGRRTLERVLAADVGG